MKKKNLKKKSKFVKRTYGTTKSKGYKKSMKRRYRRQKRRVNKMKEKKFYVEETISGLYDFKSPLIINPMALLYAI